LKQIQGAKEQWALENKKKTTDPSPGMEQLLQYFKGSTLPICYAGGSYQPGKTINDAPRCNAPGHSL
jgi:hypothetical protein